MVELLNSLNFFTLITCDFLNISTFFILFSLNILILFKHILLTLGGSIRINIFSRQSFTHKRYLFL